MWNKSGNFHRNQSVSYTNHRRDTIVKKISLCRQRDGDFRISVRARHHDSYSHLVRHIVSMGFPIPERIDQNGMLYTLTTNNRAPITNFIIAIKTLQSDFIEIEHEFCGLLAINLLQQQPAYAWIRSGNLQNLSRDDASFNRSMTYISHIPSSGIKKLELSRDANGNVFICIKASNYTLCENLKFALVAEEISLVPYNMNFVAMQFGPGTSIEDPTNHIYIQLEYATDRSEKLLGLLAVLNSFSSNFDEISHQIFTEIVNIQRVEPMRRPTGRDLFADRARMNLALQESLHTVQDPPALIINFGENARKLNDLQFSEEIPEAYQCSLTNEIMTDPVYDPRHPGQKFERISIDIALDEKQENPFNRQPLTKAELILDEALKETIHTFVDSIAKARQTLSGPRNC